MRLSYDSRYNIAYISFHEKDVEVETIHISDELNIDLSPDGTIYGIELLNANAQLRREGMARLLVVNEANGERWELPLAVKDNLSKLENHPNDKPPKSYNLEQIRSKYPRAYERWTEDEDIRLKDEYSGGKTITEVARILQRQPSAVRSRLQKQGIVVGV